MQADLGADETHWRATMKGVDVVIHAAARAHILRETERDPLRAFRALNRDATETIARAAAHAGVRRFVFVSSIGVNGNSSGEGTFTEQSPERPVTPYAISKQEAEIALREVSVATGLEMAIVRPPLVHGPEVKANFLRLLNFVDRGLPLPFGAVRNRRSVIYVGNLADLLLTCAMHPGAADELFLASDGTILSTPQLVAELAERMGKNARLIPVPPLALEAVAALAGRKHVLEQLCGSLEVDGAHARERLGWEPPIVPREALDRTVQWFLARQRGLA